MHFVYVMKEADRQKMLQLGYSLLKSDPVNHVWIFDAGDNMEFAQEDRLTQAGIKYIRSDTLTF